MPENRSLSEYVVLVTLLGKLFKRLGMFLKNNYGFYLHLGCINLLVSNVCKTDREIVKLSIATVGFTAGAKLLKSNIYVIYLTSI
jgi:predicted transcriptional regulator YheO